MTVNINQVAITGNLTREPHARRAALRASHLRDATRQRPPFTQRRHRRVGGVGGLLHRQGLRLSGSHDAQAPVPGRSRDACPRGARTASTHSTSGRSRSSPRPCSSSPGQLPAEHDMACPGCRRRASLIAALAPAIEGLALTRGPRRDRPPRRAARRQATIAVSGCAPEIPHPRARRARRRQTVVH
jgi:hypothetical protein